MNSSVAPNTDGYSMENTKKAPTRKNSSCSGIAPSKINVLSTAIHDTGEPAQSFFSSKIA
jgi:hypothetical protein